MGPGGVTSATTAQALFTRESTMPIVVALQPARGQTRSGSGRTSIGRPGRVFATSSCACFCSEAPMARVSASVPGSVSARDRTMRGQSTTTPPSAPTERLISGASPVLAGAGAGDAAAGPGSAAGAGGGSGAGAGPQPAAARMRPRAASAITRFGIGRA